MAATILNGDFNYDGKINVDDYGIIDFDIAIQGTSPAISLRSISQQSAASTTAAPISQSPAASMPSPLRKRDVFDSIFSTTGVL
jgi:hypothetical protein